MAPIMAWLATCPLFGGGGGGIAEVWIQSVESVFTGRSKITHIAYRNIA